MGVAKWHPELGRVCTNAPARKGRMRDDGRMAHALSDAKFWMAAQLAHCGPCKEPVPKASAPHATID
jgi:hypothetical protein